MNKPTLLSILLSAIIAVPSAILAQSTGQMPSTEHPVEFVAPGSSTDPTVGVWMNNTTGKVAVLRFTADGASMSLTVKPKRSIWFFGPDKGAGKITLQYAMLNSPQKIAVTGKQVRVSVTDKGLSPPCFSDEAVVPKDAGTAYADSYVSFMDMKYPSTMVLEIDGQREKPAR